MTASVSFVADLPLRTKMSEPTTALPPRDQSSIRQWLKSLEAGFRRWRHNRRLQRQAAAMARGAERVDLSGLIGRLSPRPPLPLLCLAEPFDPHALPRCLQSLVSQRYSNWRLDLIGMASDGPQLAAVLQQCGLAPGQATLHLNGDSQGNPTQTLRASVLEADQPHIGLLSGQDVLADDALLWIAATLDRQPQAAWIYADEASQTDCGEIRDFHYKPDFSWPYLLARFFTGTFAFYRRDLLLQALAQAETGGGDPLYDLALRMAEIAGEEKVVHIPQVLWFSRWQDPNSAAARQRAEQQRQAAAASLQRRGIPGQVDVHPQDSRLHQFRFEPRSQPRVSIIIPTRNAASLVKACVASLRAATRYPAYEIVVIDHQSDEPELLEYLRDQSAQGLLPRGAVRGAVQLCRHEQPGRRHDGQRVAAVLE